MLRYVAPSCPSRICVASAVPRHLPARRKPSTTSSTSPQHLVISVAAVAHPSSSPISDVEDDSPASPSFVIRVPRTDAEFYFIASLRADAYYADQPGGGGRFVESYKKQFREQEARSLAQRVAPRRRKNSTKESARGVGGGGVFGGVLGALLGRGTDGASSSSSSDVASSSPSSEAAVGTKFGLVEEGDDDEYLPPECVCLVAVEEEDVAAVVEREGGVAEEETSSSPSSTSSSSSIVLGALDVRPPACAGGGHPAGVPASGDIDTSAACAVLNVAVAPSARRRGVARALLSQATELASTRWGATAMYTTVAATNSGARALYSDFGFVEVVAEASRGVGVDEEMRPPSYSPSTLVGKELLLRAEI